MTDQKTDVLASRVGRRAELAAAADPRGTESRATELVDAAPEVLAADAPWENPSQLVAPKPRPGMEQRWIRTSARNGEVDAMNADKARRYGWTPRKAETVPGYVPPTIQHGQFSGFIGVGEMVLMERPKVVGEKHRAYLREQTANRELAIQRELQQAGPEMKQHRSTKVTRGNPEPAAD